MTDSTTQLASGSYIGQTAANLSRKTGADMVAAGVSQKALFQRRGTITLFADRLVLGAWHEGSDLVLTKSAVRSARLEFTDLYGRFIGGLLNAGKPLILTLADGAELYLLIDRKEFMETTDDRRWAALVQDWLSRP